MNYVDGYLIPVPNKNKDAYVELAKISAAVFKDHGALHVAESWGDEVPDGELTSFPMAVKLEADETVVFSWIIWPSKEARDEGVEKAMKDERFEVFKGKMPFDGKRMIYGGYRMIVDE